VSEFRKAYFGFEWDSDQYDKPWHDSEFLRNVYELDQRLSYRDIGEELGVSYTMINRNMPDDANKGGKGHEYENIALFSGGHDSLVSTHKVMEQMGGDAVVHIDTQTGLEENKEFVQDVCETYDWTLHILTPEKTLAEFGKEYGFPKAGSHGWIYAYLKQHPLDKFVTRLDTNMPVFYTGVRKHESERRMRTVTTEREKSSHGRWYWDSPIADFTDDEVETYMETHDLPRSPVVENIGRSGECFCGAYSDRFSELEVLREEYEYHYEWLMDVEEEVQKEMGTDESHCYWGSSGLSSDQLQRVIEENEKNMVMCEDCEGVGHRTLNCDITESDTENE